jgi:hypothetical protein
MTKISLERSARTWDFETDGNFVGKFLETETITPEDTTKDPFDQHLCVDDAGEIIAIPDNYQISKAIKKMHALDIPKEVGVLMIEFKGQITQPNGRKMSMFNIDVDVPDNPTTSEKKGK